MEPPYYAPQRTSTYYMMRAYCDKYHIGPADYQMAVSELKFLEAAVSLRPPQDFYVPWTPNPGFPRAVIGLMTILAAQSGWKIVQVTETQYNVVYSFPFQQTKL